MDTQGSRLKKIRQELKLSQEEFAKKIGVSKQYISNLEADRYTLNNERLVSLAVDFKVSLNYLLLGIGEMFLYKDAASEYENIKKDILAEVKIMLVNQGLMND